MESILKMSSSPQLPKLELQQAIIEAPSLPRSASCGDLDSPGPGSFSFKAETRTSIRASVSKLETIRAIEKLLPPKKVDFFQRLPDELSMRIFSYLRPKELVRASLVSNFMLREL